MNQPCTAHGYGCSCRAFHVERIERERVDRMSMELSAIDAVVELATALAKRRGHGDQKLAAYVLNIAIRDKRRVCGVAS